MTAAMTFPSATALDATTIRVQERSSIREFVESTAHYLIGDVLDFGAGKPGTCRTPQPYRDLVHGQYFPYDIGDRPPQPYYDSILCTQVLQYIANPIEQITEFYNLLRIGGHLVCTYPTSWDEVEPTDLWRFTKHGMERMLIDTGFEIIDHRLRSTVELNGFHFNLGYGVVAKKLKPLFTPNQEESAAILTHNLRNHRPFTFLRYGDGMIECIYGTSDARSTTDGELYTKELGKDLLSAWQLALTNTTGLYVGDWLSASFSARDKFRRYEHEYKQLLHDRNISRLHYESLLFMNNRSSHARLTEFWAAVRDDDRRKVIMGPAELAQIAHLLGCKHIITPIVSDLHKSIDVYRRMLLDEEFDVLLWGAGMASNIAVIECRAQYPDRTYINIGSALDPICRGRTRTQQMSRQVASDIFVTAVRKH